MAGNRRPPRCHNLAALQDHGLGGVMVPGEVGGDEPTRAEARIRLAVLLEAGEHEVARHVRARARAEDFAALLDGDGERIVVGAAQIHGEGAAAAAKRGVRRAVRKGARQSKVALATDETRTGDDDAAVLLDYDGEGLRPGAQADGGRGHLAADPEVWIRQPIGHVAGERKAAGAARRDAAGAGDEDLTVLFDGER